MRALDLLYALTFRGGEMEDPLKYVVEMLKKKLLRLENMGLNGKKIADETRIAVKAYGCEFDNYMTCRNPTEMDIQLKHHRREHLDHWNQYYVCQTRLPFSETKNDEDYDEKTKSFVLHAHKLLMDFRIPLPFDCIVYHGLVGYQKTFQKAWRYLSTTTDLHTAINFAMNKGLIEEVEDKSDLPVVLEIFLPAGTMVFSTNVCFCVQEEDEITLAYPGEINVIPKEKKYVKEQKYYSYPEETVATRNYYSIPATLSI